MCQDLIRIIRTYNYVQSVDIMDGKLIFMLLPLCICCETHAAPPMDVFHQNVTRTFACSPRASFHLDLTLAVKPKSLITGMSRGPY